MSGNTFYRPKKNVMDSSTIHYESSEMQLARTYILDNLDKPPTIAQIAKHACQSESSLKRKFKAAYNCSVYEFIRYSRIMKAKALFDTGKYTVTQVAYEIGYSNISHFSKAFRQYVNCNPSSYLNKRTK